MFAVLAAILFCSLIALAVLCVLAFVEGAYGTGPEQSKEGKNAPRVNTEERQTTTVKSDDYRMIA